MAESRDFIKVNETEDYIYYTNEYFDSTNQVVRKADGKMFELFAFGDDRMLIMDSGITYEDACRYEEYIDENGYPKEKMLEWFRSAWDFTDNYEINSIEEVLNRKEAN